ncbi:hypothetical protein E4U39_004175 [Claviceps sp. Clav50 group G5]|nr:hypothetical protein E4U39_004175 [Claviceps sp. Clav50 group G5]
MEFNEEHLEALARPLQQNDIYTLVRKMLNWWESGHSRHVVSKPANLLNDFFTGVTQFIHA